jgi:hypothetical protein
VGVEEAEAHWEFGNDVGGLRRRGDIGRVYLWGVKVVQTERSVTTLVKERDSACCVSVE